MGRLTTLRSAVATLGARVPSAPKTADAHYASPEHKKWRAAVIARAGGACQGGGCGARGVRLFADHIVELRDGGEPFALDNGQALCGSCHSSKTARERTARQRR